MPPKGGGLFIAQSRADRALERRRKEEKGGERRRKEEKGEDLGRRELREGMI